MHRLLAIDPSLTCSGWSLFDISKGQIRSVGLIRSKGTRFTLPDRLRDFHQQVQKLFSTLKIGEGDILVCEAPSTVIDPKATFKVEQIRGIFENTARDFKALVPGRLNPRTVQREALGLFGKQIERKSVKALARKTVQFLYGETLTRFGIDPALVKYQDIIDSILIGHVALSKLEASKRASISVEEMFLEAWDR